MRKNLPMSLRDKIQRARRGWTALAVSQISYIGLFTGLHFSGIISTSAWLSSTIAAVLFLAYDLRMLIRVLRALHTYKTNPAAAYIAEIHNAFNGS